MSRADAEVLISGASVAGPVLAYWLRRYGFTPVVVERTPELRRGTGGHGVDLFDAAAQVIDRMGLWEEICEARTRTETLTIERPGRKPVDVDLGALITGFSERHVEVMRGELAEILHRHTRDDVEYVFGDSIRTIDQDEHGVDVTFEHGPPRRFGMVIGADGLHSNVRRLTFGPEERHLHFLGGHLAVFTLPNYRGLDAADGHAHAGGQAGRHVPGLADRPGACRVPVPERRAAPVRPPRPGPAETPAPRGVRRTWAGRCPGCSTRWAGPATSTSTRSARSAWTPGRAAA